MAAASIRGVSIFYCYANEDEHHLREIEKHLGPLKRLGKVTTWYDRHIAPGMDWAYEIETHLNAADIILLLISPDFMQSDYCYNVEMHLAFKRRKNEKTEVIPIILRPINWQDTPLGDLQAMPTKGKPVTLWDRPDEAYLDVAEGINKVVRLLLAFQWNNEGKAHYMAGNHNEALRLSPDKADFYGDKGDVFLELNRNDEALDAYDNAIRLSFNNAHFYVYKGLALTKLNRYNEALVAYDQALHVNPQDPYTYVRKGNVLLDLKRPDAALVAFEQALQLNSNISEAHYGRGRAFDVLGKANEAQQAYQKAQSLGR